MPYRIHSKSYRTNHPHHHHHQHHHHRSTYFNTNRHNNCSSSIAIHSSITASTTARNNPTATQTRPPLPPPSSSSIQTVVVVPVTVVFRCLVWIRIISVVAFVVVAVVASSSVVVCRCYHLWWGRNDPFWLLRQVPVAVAATTTSSISSSSSSHSHIVRRNQRWGKSRGGVWNNIHLTSHRYLHNDYYSIAPPSFIPLPLRKKHHPPQERSLPSIPTTTKNNVKASSPSSKCNTIIVMKAWTCHGRNQRDMVQQLQQAGIIRSPPVVQVMSCVDRKQYFPTTSTITSTTRTQRSNNTNNSYNCYYVDAPHPIGYGQTISAPHMHAYVLEEIITHVQQQQRLPHVSTTITPQHHRPTSTSGDLMNRSQNRSTYHDTGNNEASSPTPPPPPMLQFLDVGCGSGYITACFGRWLAPSTLATTTTNNNNNHTTSSLLGVSGYVYGMDIVPELVTLTRTNIQKQDADLLLPPPQRQETDHDLSTGTIPSNEQPTSPLTQPIVTLLVGNGYHGLPQYAPFDIIHVGAAAMTFPYALCQQLKVGGLMIVPIQENHDHLYPTTPSQTLYKIERLYDPNHPVPNDTSIIGTTSPSSSVTDIMASTVSNVPETTTSVTDDASSTTFNIHEYRITPLLGVRYVPLVQE